MDISPFSYNELLSRQVRTYEYMNNWEKLKISSVAVATVVIPVAIAFVGQEYSAALKERELQGKFVELAVEVLRAKPEKQNISLRSWAVGVIDTYSGIPMKKQARESLIEKGSLPSKKPVITMKTGKINMGKEIITDVKPEELDAVINELESKGVDDIKQIKNKNNTYTLIGTRWTTIKFPGVEYK